MDSDYRNLLKNNSISPFEIFFGIIDNNTLFESINLHYTATTQVSS